MDSTFNCELTDLNPFSSGSNFQHKTNPYFSLIWVIELTTFFTIIILTIIRIWVCNPNPSQYVSNLLVMLAIRNLIVLIRTQIYKQIMKRHYSLYTNLRLYKVFGCHIINNMWKYPIIDSICNTVIITQKIVLFYNN